MLQERQQTVEFNSPDVLSLKGVGYDLGGDILRFKRDYMFFLEKGQNKEESIVSSSLNVAKNLEGFWFEYVKRSSVLEMPYEFKTINEKREVVSPNYADTLMKDIVSKKERKGAVYDSVELISNFLSEASPGSIALFTSPPGGNVWDGEKREFIESQTFVYIVDDKGDLHAKTLITDMDVFENISFLRLMGMEKGFSPDLNEVELEEEIARSVFTKKGDENRSFSFFDVISAIRLAKDSEYLRGNVSFNDFCDMVENPEELSSSARSVISEFLVKVSLQAKYLDEKELRSLIATAVLNLVAYHKKDLGFGGFVDTGGKVNIIEAYTSALMLTGCAGGGLTQGVPSGEAKYVRRCGQCGTSIESFISRGYRCRKCGGVYEGC